MIYSSINLAVTNILVNREKDESFFSIVSGNTVQKIQEVVADFPYKQFSISTLRSILPTMHSRVVCLSDGSRKLYLHARLLGGGLPEGDLQRAEQLGIYNPDIADKQVATNILNVIGDSTYSSVFVDTRDYQFMGRRASHPSRMISLTPGAWQFFVNVMKVLVYKQDHHRPNGNAVVSAVLGSNDPDDLAWLEASFRSNKNICVFFSFAERGLFDIGFENSPFTEYAAGIRDNIVKALPSQPAVQNPAFPLRDEYFAQRNAFNEINLRDHVDPAEQVRVAKLVDEAFVNLLPELYKQDCVQVDYLQEGILAKMVRIDDQNSPWMPIGYFNGSYRPYRRWCFAPLPSGMVPAINGDAICTWWDANWNQDHKVGSVQLLTGKHYGGKNSGEDGIYTIYYDRYGREYNLIPVGSLITGYVPARTIQSIKQGYPMKQDYSLIFDKHIVVHIACNEINYKEHGFEQHGNILWPKTNGSFESFQEEIDLQKIGLEAVIATALIAYSN